MKKSIKMLVCLTLLAIMCLTLVACNFDGDLPLKGADTDEKVVEALKDFENYTINYFETTSEGGTGYKLCVTTEGWSIVARDYDIGENNQPAYYTTYEFAYIKDGVYYYGEMYYEDAWISLDKKGKLVYDKDHPMKDAWTITKKTYEEGDGALPYASLQQMLLSCIAKYNECKDDESISADTYAKNQTGNSISFVWNESISDPEPHDVTVCYEFSGFNSTKIEMPQADLTKAVEA